MNLPEVVNVGIGVVLLFVLLSSLGSVLVDLIGQALRYREEILTVTVNRLLTGIDDRPWPMTTIMRDRVVEKLLAVAPGQRLRAVIQRGQPREELISASGDAALDVINTATVRAFWTHAKIRSLAAPGSVAPTWLDASTFAAVLIDIAVPRDSANTLPDTRVALERRLGPGNTAVPEALRRSLLSLGLSSSIPAGAAGESLWNAFRANIASWYDEAMASATQRYRHLTQRWLLWIGVGLAAILNADTIRTVHVLSHDKALAEQVAAYAEINKARAEPRSPDESLSLDEARAEAADSLRELQKLSQLGYPLGWRFDSSTDFLPSRFPTQAGPGPVLPNPLTHPWAWVVKLLGLAITALAVSQGAPFWYNLLNKIIAWKRGGSGAANTAPAADSPTPAASASGPTGPAGAFVLSGGAGSTPAVPLEIGRDLARATVGFDPRKAVWLAEAASLAYAAAPNIESVASREWFFSETKFWSRQVGRVDTQAFAVVDDSVAIVAFRGTEPKVLNDILTDARLRKALFAEGSAFAEWGSVHGGFAEALAPVMVEILDWLRDRGVAGKSLYITGHSLGGALATLFAAQLARESVTAQWQFQLYTFGSPLVGDRNFAATVDRRLQGRVFRLVHGADIVTQVPPCAFDFSHVGEMLHFTKPDGLRREVGSLDRLFDLAIAGVEDLRQAARETVEDHSMDHYIKRCRALATAAV